MKKIIIILTLLIAYGSNLTYGQPVTITFPNGSKTIINDPDAFNQMKDAKRVTLDSAYMRVSYRQLIIQDTLNSTNPQSYVMLLQLGKRLTKYWDFGDYTIDSLTAAYRKAGENTISIIQKTAGLNQGANREVIFSNMKPDYLTVTLSMPLARLNSEYEEVIPDIKWHLEKDTMTVLDYPCRKATCRLFGRNYTAWYTPILPVNKGPWKFSGLPGLILKLSDDREQVFFDCIGIERISWIDPIYLTEKEYVKSDKKTVLKTYDTYKSDPTSYVESSGVSITSIDSQSAKPRKKFYYNPIELSE